MSCRTDRLSLLVVSAGAAVLPVVLAATGCGNDAAPTDPAPVVRTLTVSPDRATPGAPIRLEGIAPSALGDAELTLVIGGQPALLRLEDEGLLAGVPLFFDADVDAPAPPAVPVDIELMADGVLIGEARAALSVDALPDAPGTAEALALDLSAIAADLRVVWSTLPPGPTAADGQITGWFGALEDIFTGTHEFALPALMSQLSSEDPDALALVEGVLAASGLAEQTHLLAEFGSALRTYAEELAARRASRVVDGHARRAVDVIPDWDLAARMQLYVMMRDFGEQVVSETGQTWGNTVGIVSGAVGIGTTVPLVGQISAVFSVVSFAINKVALAYLPATITSFEIELASPFVPPGEVPETELWLDARSDPPAIGIQDLIDGILLGLGIANSSGPAQTFREFLAATADWYLGVVRSIMSAYAAQHPEVPMDVDIASIPVMYWRARVVTDRLVDRFTLTPDIIYPVEDIVAWRAEIDASGEGKIYARPAIGPDVTNLPLIPGYAYTSGAFGDDIVPTPTTSIVVAPEVVLEVSMAPTITPGGINGLEARAGTRGPTGDITWTAGILVECTATGGGVDPASGLTGPDGRFDTFVTLDDGSSAVEVAVVATGDYDMQATATATAVAAGGSGLVVLRENECSVGASSQARAGWGSGCMDNDLANSPYNSVEDFSASVGISCTATSPDGACSATASGSGSLESRLFYDPGSGSLVRVHATASGTANGSTSGCEEMDPYARGSFSSWVAARFDVQNDAISFALTGTLDGYAEGFVHLSLFHRIGYPNDYDVLGDQYLVRAHAVVDVSGTLEPGAYDLMVQQIGRLPTAAGGTRSGGWEIELLLSP